MPSTICGTQSTAQSHGLRIPGFLRSRFAELRQRMVDKQAIAVGLLMVVGVVLVSWLAIH